MSGNTLAAKDMVGSWTLVDSRITGKDGNIINKFEDGTTGLLIYTADGYMSAAVVFADGQGGSRPMFYAGPYELREGQNIHHIEFSSDPDLVGSEQVREARYDGESLTLSSASSIVGGPGAHAVMVWKRN